MNLQTKFDIQANLFAEAHSQHLKMVLAAYNRVILDSRLNYSSIVRFQKELDEVTKIYLDKLARNVEAAYAVVTDAVEDANEAYDAKVLEAPEWEGYVQDNANFTFEAIKLQALKDNLFAINYLRTKTLQLMNLNDHEAAFQLVFNSKDLNFFYTDKLGRKVNSVKFVRTAIRDFMVKNYNDLVIGIAGYNNVQEVQIKNLDKGHQHDGTTIDLSDGGYLEYYKVRDEIFHPNSNSIIEV